MNAMFRITAAGAICLAAGLLYRITSAGIGSPFFDLNQSSVSANPGIGLVCPQGDGDALSNIGSTVTVVLKDYTGEGVASISATDMWLVGCDEGLLLCGGSAGSSADGATNALGQATFSNEPIAGGCDSGLYVVVMGWVIQNPATGLPHCLPIQVRSPDYKSAGAPGPVPCAGDIACPDSRVTMADFSWFASHYANANNPGVTYLACADLAAPFGEMSLADLSKISVHFGGTGHRCAN